MRLLHLVVEVITDVAESQWRASLHLRGGGKSATARVVQSVDFTRTCISNSVSVFVAATLVVEKTRRIKTLSKLLLSYSPDHWSAWTGATHGRLGESHAFGDGVRALLRSWTGLEFRVWSEGRSRLRKCSCDQHLRAAWRHTTRVLSQHLVKERSSRFWGIRSSFSLLLSFRVCRCTCKVTAWQRRFAPCSSGLSVWRHISLLIWVSCCNSGCICSCLSWVTLVLYKLWATSTTCFVWVFRLRSQALKSKLLLTLLSAPTSTYFSLPISSISERSSPITTTFTGITIAIVGIALSWSDILSFSITLPLRVT